MYCVNSGLGSLNLLCLHDRLAVLLCAFSLVNPAGFVRRIKSFFVYRSPVSPLTPGPLLLVEPTPQSVAGHVQGLYLAAFLSPQLLGNGCPPTQGPLSSLRIQRRMPLWQEMQIFS